MDEDLTARMHMIGEAARKASRILATTSTIIKNSALSSIADCLSKRAPAILEANAIDLEAASRACLSSVMIERLKLDKNSLKKIIDGIRHAMTLPDPIGRVLKHWVTPQGLSFSKISVPIGVIAIIYESRPNVTSDASVLCLKAGNAVILRGGREAIHSNQAIATVLQEGIIAAGLPAELIQFIPVTDHKVVRILCEMDQSLDCIIPRGGKTLIKAVTQYARMPVIKHYEGICTIYIDKFADILMAREIILNAKCQNPSACNAVETLLIHRESVNAFFLNVALPLIAQGVELRCDASLYALVPVNLKNHSLIKEAVEEDWRTEFLELILAVKLVESLEEAIAHIELNSSHHSDAIVTNDCFSAERFLQLVDSATVYWNASTRFTDGGEFGFGCEIGVSTDKLHARGPMALEELTSYKYQIRGTGQIRG